MSSRAVPWTPPLYGHVTIPLEGRGNPTGKERAPRERSSPSIPSSPLPPSVPDPGIVPGDNDPEQPDPPDLGAEPPGTNEPPPGEEPTPEIVVSGTLPGLMLGGALVAVPWQRFLLPTVTVTAPRRKPGRVKPKPRPRRRPPKRVTPRRPARVPLRQPFPPPKKLPARFPLITGGLILGELIFGGGSDSSIGDRSTFLPPVERPDSVDDLQPVRTTVGRLPAPNLGLPTVVVSAPRTGGGAVPNPARGAAPRTFLPPSSEPRLQPIPVGYVGLPQRFFKPAPQRPKRQPRLDLGVTPGFSTPSPVTAPRELPDLRSPPVRTPAPGSPSPITPPGANPITLPTFPGNLTALQPLAVPLAATERCRCPPKQRKKRKSRTECRRGTYVETASGLIKSPKEKVPCR